MKLALSFSAAAFVMAHGVAASPLGERAIEERAGRSRSHIVSQPSTDLVPLNSIMLDNAPSDGGQQGSGSQILQRLVGIYPHRL